MLLSRNKIQSIAFALFLLLLNAIYVSGQTPAKSANLIPHEPLFLIDGKEILKSQMAGINPDDIATVTVLKNDSSKDYGEIGKNGVVLIETKVHCRQRFQQYLSKKSPAYNKILSNYKNDQNIQYILNGKVLKKDYEGDLASITDSTFISINVIGTQELKNYCVTEKHYGVLIETKAKGNTVNQATVKSRFEPELMIISPGKVSFDPSAKVFQIIPPVVLRIG